MFFTPQLLEQATDEHIAAYKAQRYPRGASVADLCCGIGGDLGAIARRGPTIGVDRDSIAAELAAANCRALELPHVRTETADVAGFDVAGWDAWHIDPDRRTRGSRTTRVEWGSPGQDALERLMAARADGAIKLAPAATVPVDWSAVGERDWVGSRRECRQQIVWLGQLARASGLRTATVVNPSEGAVSFSGMSDQDPDPAPAIDQFVYEPHAAVLAARLTGALALERHLLPIAPELAYLTGGYVDGPPLLATFQVHDVLPMDVKKVRSALRARRIGQLEIKVRGVRIAPDRLQRQLHVPGDQAATLLIAGTKDRTLAILAKRCDRRAGRAGDILDGR